MIVKHVPMRTQVRSNFAGLVNYVTDAQSKDHRLGPVQITNCDAVSVQDAITEVLATQHINTRAKGDKTYHLIVSFRTGEHPAADTLRAIEARICTGLGYGEHQRISAVHTDTDNLHIHIAINKIHPVRHTMHEPYYPHRMLAELCTALERDYGLEHDNHVSRRRGAESRAADMERHSGVESLVSWIRRECLDGINAARSWSELHRVMHDNGLELRVRANGFVIVASDGTMVKASTVERALSKPKLEARLGPFAEQPAAGHAKRHYQQRPLPLRVNTVELYARYKTEQQTLTASRGLALQQVRKRKDRLIEAAKRTARLRRATIKVIGESRANKKLLYAQASKALHNEIQVINQQFKRERQGLYDNHSRSTWADWLRKEATSGNAEALTALRAREAAQGLKGNTIRGIRGRGDSLPSCTPATDSITKKGTIIFRAGQSAVRDDGDKLQVSRDATHEGLQVVLRLAMERYGSCITVNGSVEFKAQIIRAAVDTNLPISFADPALESRRQEILNKRHTHERTEEHRGRTGRSSGGPGQRARTDQRATTISTTVRTSNGQRKSIRGISSDKPHVGRVGRVPPAQSQNRLRSLSELGVVRIASGSEVLLPRNVPRDMEQQRTKPVHSLRRGISVEGEQNLDGHAAADKYIAERESKRAIGFDISKHVRYTVGDGPLSFSGVRHVDGQPLALLQRDDETMVMPIDHATARRLSRIKIGAAISITPKGSIKTTKGRGQ